MALTISPAALAVVGTVIVCIIGLRIYFAALHTVERINSANNAATERMSQNYNDHVERMAQLQAASQDRRIVLMVAERYRVDTQAARQMILSGHADMRLIESPR